MISACPKAQRLSTRGASDETTEPLVDAFGREHTYMRLSVTDRCNLRCFYCMPPEGIPLRQREEILTFEEIERLIRILAGMGIKKVRLTGGEPLVRVRISDLVRRIVQIPGIDTVAMTTNGVLLKHHAKPLREAGLRSLNISLDTLRPERFRQIALRGSYDDSREGIDAALEAGFDSVKLNIVVIGGINDDELIDFADFAVERSLNIRFIEYMPFRANQWRPGRTVPYQTMRETIEEKYSLVPSSNEAEGVAKIFHIAGYSGAIGFITSVSEHFCGECNRLRIMADGSMKTCLFHAPETELRTALRDGTSDEDMRRLIRRAVLEKAAQHRSMDELTETDQQTMLEIGG